MKREKPVFRLHTFTLSGVEQVKLFEQENITSLRELLDYAKPKDFHGPGGPTCGSYGLCLEYWRENSPPSWKGRYNCGPEGLPKHYRLIYAVLKGGTGPDKYASAGDWQIEF